MVKIKSISFILAVLIMSFLIGYFVFAWQEPTQSPTGGNVPAPINVGSDLQEKTGSLRVSGFQTRSHTYLATDVGINVGIGTTSPLQKLHSTGYIRADSGYCIGTSCITSWPSGAALPTGSSGQTLHHTGTAWVANSIIFNNGTNVGIGTTSPGYRLDVSGTGRFTGDITAGSGIVLGGVRRTTWPGDSSSVSNNESYCTMEPHGGICSTTVYCPSNMYVTGGGFRSTHLVTAYVSQPTGTSQPLDAWYCVFYNRSTYYQNGQCYAICAPK